MNKLTVLILGILMMIAFTACTSKQVKQETINISVSNQTSMAVDADVWIITDTEENRKSTTWGKANYSKLSIGSSSEARVTLSENSSYLIRIIEANDMYYEANSVILENNQSIIIKDNNDDNMSEIVDVYDKDGKLVGSYEMFVARL